MKKIYLATPYSDSDPAVMEARFEAVTRKAGQIINWGYIVYSPVTSCHPVAVRCSLPRGFDYWQQFDETFIEWCDELWVLQLDGWRESVGVKAEVKIAEKLHKPAVYINV